MERLTSANGSKRVKEEEEDKEEDEDENEEETEEDEEEEDDEEEDITVKFYTVLSSKFSHIF